MHLRFRFTAVPVHPTNPQAKVDELAKDLSGKLEEMRQLTVTQAEYEAMETEVTSMAKQLEDMRKRVEAKDKASLDLEVSKVAVPSMTGPLRSAVSNTNFQ